MRQSLLFLFVFISSAVLGQSIEQAYQVCHFLPQAYQQNPQSRCPALYQQALWKKLPLEQVETKFQGLHEYIAICGRGMQGNHIAVKAKLDAAKTVLGPDTIARIEAVAAQNVQGGEALATSGNIDQTLAETKGTLENCVSGEELYLRTLSPVEKIASECSFAPLIPANSPPTDPMAERVVSAHTKHFDQQSDDYNSLIAEIRSTIQDCKTQIGTADSLIARAAEIRARVASSTNPDLVNGGGNYQTQPVDKKPSKGMEMAKKVCPGILGALMAGAGMAAGQGGGDKPKPQQKPNAPQAAPEAKPIADAKPPAEDSKPENAASETAKGQAPGGVIGGPTADASLVKVTSGKVTKTEVTNPDGTKKIITEVKGHEKSDEPAEEQTASNETSDQLDSDQSTIGANQGAETGAQLASGSTGGGRALAGESSGAGGGYLGSGGYVGTGHRGYAGGGMGGEAAGSAAALDNNYIGATYAEGDSGAGVTSAPGRKRRRPSGLPMCGPNSKANGMACQEIQKLRDDRAERKKGDINNDEYLNIAPARARKR